MHVKIKACSYDEAKQFINIPWLTLKEKYVYFGLFCGDSLLSIVGIEEYKGNKYKTHCNFTPKQLRGKGYFSILLKTVLGSYLRNAKYVIADCTDDSVHIYEKLGFRKCGETIKRKKYNITKMRYSDGKTEN